MRKRYFLPFLWLLSLTPSLTAHTQLTGLSPKVIINYFDRNLLINHWEKGVNVILTMI